MAHSFSITDGTTTFYLTTTNSMLVNYDMGAPRFDSRPRNPQETEVSVDTIDIMIYATTPALMQTAANTLQALLSRARFRAETKSGPRVYMQAQLDSDSGVWRSEILGAELKLKENSLAVWANAKMEAQLHIERRPYWEGPRTQLQLSNGSTTATSNWVVVYNHDDAGTNHDNWVQIASTQVTGDMPAPIELHVKNNTGSDSPSTCEFITVNTWNDPANQGFFWFEGEGYSGYSTATGLSTTADSNASNGNYMTWVYNGSVYAYWNLSAAQVSDMAGHPFRVILFFKDYPPNGYVTPRITNFATVTTLQTSLEVALDDGDPFVVDVGTLNVPPGGYSTLYTQLELTLAFRFATQQTLKLDAVLLAPARSTRYIWHHNTSWSNAAELVIDEIEERHYMLDSNQEGPWISAHAQPLVVWPGQTQRIAIATSRASAFGNDALLQREIKAWYRPRRMTI